MLDEKTLKILIENYDEFERMVHEIAERVDNPEGRRSSTCESFYQNRIGEIDAEMCYPSHCNCCSDEHGTITFPLALLFKKDWEKAATEEGQRQLAEIRAKEKEGKRLEQKKREEQKKKREEQKKEKDKKEYARLKKQFEEK